MYYPGLICIAFREKPELRGRFFIYYFDATEQNSLVAFDNLTLNQPEPHGAVRAACASGVVHESIAVLITQFPSELHSIILGFYRELIKEYAHIFFRILSRGTRLENNVLII